MSVPTIAAIALAVIGGSYMLYGLYASWKATESKEWLPVQCVIRSSFIDRRMTGKGTYIRPVIVFDYRIQGQHFRSGRARVADKVGMMSIERAEAICRRYPVGLSTTAYYNPDHPAEAVLIRGAHSGIFFLLFFGVVALGLSLIITLMAV